jgi:hypothetical protein
MSKRRNRGVACSLPNDPGGEYMGFTIRVKTSREERRVGERAQRKAQRVWTSSTPAPEQQVVECFTGKRAFYDERAALGALREVQRVREQHGEESERRVYRCRWCRQWHLTSKTGR